MPAAKPKPIDMISADLIAIVVKPDPGQAGKAVATAWAEAIRAAAERFEMTTIRRIAAFMAQMAHESGLKVGREENLNYSASRMAEVWPKRFAISAKAAPGTRQPNDLAKSLDHDPEAFGNYIYANRLGNGPPETGDGYRFRGVGPGQLTGRANRQAFADAMGMTLDEAEAYIRTLEGGVMSFAWFWEENDINRLADTPGVSDETRAINGGENGLADRKAKFDALVAAMLRLEAGR